MTVVKVRIASFFVACGRAALEAQSHACSEETRGAGNTHEDLKRFLARWVRRALPTGRGSTPARGARPGLAGLCTGQAWMREEVWMA